MWKVLALLGFVLATTEAVVWSQEECKMANGIVKDAVCCESYLRCNDYKDEDSCLKDIGCYWKEAKGNKAAYCMINRDDRNDVCCIPTSEITVAEDDPCSSIVNNNQCPHRHVVPAACCTIENRRNLPTPPGNVCCNAPCTDWKKQCSNKPLPDYCGANDDAGMFRSFGGMGPMQYSSMYGVAPALMSNYRPGSLGMSAFRFDPYTYSSPNKEEFDEITIDKTMDAILDAMDNDEDVFESDYQVNRHPLFGVHRAGEGTKGFNFMKPEYFLNELYGNPFPFSSRPPMMPYPPAHLGQNPYGGGYGAPGMGMGMYGQGMYGQGMGMGAAGMYGQGAGRYSPPMPSQSYSGMYTSPIQSGNLNYRYY